MTEDVEILAEIKSSLSAIAIFLYTTSRYPGTSLNEELEKLEALYRQDRATLEALRDVNSEALREERHAARMASLENLQAYEAEHPMLVRYRHQSVALSPGHLR